MSDEQSSRRKFLQLLGLTAGAALISTDALAAVGDNSEIKILNNKQQEFMSRYEKWMDEFIAVIRIQKTDPDNINMANHKKMMALTEQSEAFQPELTEHMKDEIFSFNFRICIQRMSKEI